MTLVTGLPRVSLFLQSGTPTYSHAKGVIFPMTSAHLVSLSYFSNSYGM